MTLSHLKAKGDPGFCILTRGHLGQFSWEPHLTCPGVRGSQDGDGVSWRQAEAPPLCYEFCEVGGQVLLTLPVSPAPNTPHK